MEIYIVATIRELGNKITGYLAFDLDDKKSMIVSKASMIEAVVAGRAKIHNAALLKNSGSKIILSKCAMKGTRYSLDILSYYYKEQPYEIFNRGLLVLKQKENNKWCIISVSNANTVNCAEVTTNILNDYIMQGKVLNYDAEKRDILAAKNICSSNEENTANSMQTIVSKQEDVNPRLAELTRRALDNDDIWDMDTFDEFMKLKGWEYVVNKSRLVSLDYRCDIIHLPIDIKEVGRMVMGKSINHPIKKIIIGPKTREFSSLTENQYFADKLTTDEYIEVEEIYFQKADRTQYDTSEIYIGKFTNCLHITKALNIPYDFSSISGLYNYCIIEPQIILDNKHPITQYKLWNSFKKTEFKQSSLIINNMVEISDSFYCSIGLREIYIRKAEKLNKIEASFNNIATLNKVNFSEMTKLLNINNSFMGCGFTQVDLSNCILLYSITNASFNECEHLESITLPSNLGAIDLNNLHGTMVKHLEIDMHKAKCYYISDAESNLQIRWFNSSEDNILRIHNDFLHNTSSNTRMSIMDKIENGEDILDNVTIDTNIVLEQEAFSTWIRFESTHNQRLFRKVVKLEDEAFSRSRIKIFDSADLPNIDTISSNCFKLGKIEKVVLDKNIVSIGVNGFKQATSLETLIVSENLKKISKSAFSDTRSSNIVRVYAVRGSYASSFFKAINNFVVVDVDSVDEARDIVFGDSLHSNEKINKFRMIWGNIPEYSWIFEEPFVNNIGNIAKVLLAVDNKTESNNLVYERPNLLNVRLDSMPKMYNEFYEKLYKSKELKQLGSEDSQIEIGRRISFDKKLDISDKFIMLSDICREFCEPYAELFNTNINERIESGDLIINGSELLLVDKDRAIMRYELGSDCSYSKIELICIIESGIIVYAGVINTKLNKVYAMFDIRSDRCFYIGMLSKNYNKSLKYDIKKPLSEILNTGDIICQGCCEGRRGKGRVETKVVISGAEFANFEDITFDMLLYFLGNTFYIGTYFETSPKAKLAIPYGIFVDSRSKTVFICKLLINSTDSTHLIGVMISEKIAFSDMKELHRLVDERLSTLNDPYNTKCQFKIAKKVILYGNNIDNMVKSDMSYYDVDRNNTLARLADKVYKNNYRNISDDIPEEFMYELFNSSLMRRANCSFNEIKDSDEYIRVKTYTYKNKYIQVYSYIDGYVMGIIDKKTKMSDKDVLKFSLLNLDSMFDMLFKMGYILNNNQFRITPVSNRKISEDYMIKVYAISNEYSEFNANFFIGIDKLSGYSHILLDCGNKEVISILRFNSLIDAYDVLTDYIVTQDTFGPVLKSILEDKPYDQSSKFNRTRNAIIDGYNMMLSTKRSNNFFREDVLKKACKQPPESAMPDIFIK